MGQPHPQAALLSLLLPPLTPGRLGPMSCGSRRPCSEALALRPEQPACAELEKAWCIIEDPAQPDIKRPSTLKNEHIK